MAKQWFIYFVVFVSGAAVLAVEILGTRILGPFYGVSLFLWSALITVTLAALSLGYVLGGRWADRGPQLTRLCSLLALASLWLILIPWLKQPLLYLAEPLGLRFAVLVAAFVLFAPPLTLLGMVSPYALRLRAVSLAEVGRTAGDLYALSTIGSVLSALLTGFFLIPNIGVSRLMLAIGLTLLVTAAFGFALSRNSSTGALTGLLLLLLGASLSAALPMAQARPEHGLLAVEHSTYAELRVLETEAGRHLLIDGGIHTIVEPEFLESTFPYVGVLDIVKKLFVQPGDLLVIGVGGGSVIKNFARAGWNVSAVEIDPAVTKMALRYFALDSSQARIHHADGRQFLSTRADSYDVIILDAFGSSAIPFHLVTREAFALMRSRLRPEGVLAINVETVGWHHILTRSLTATLQQHFQHVLALPIAEPPNRLGNVILLAADRPVTLLRELERNYADPDYRFSMDYQRVHAWDNRFVPNTRRAPVLSDDWNPVELWSEQVNLVARQDLHDYFRESGLSW
ncbi:MAG: fused MFS/spermidine synthase [candidate division KSB1 bacterium]|nr:fused MFS/spermidine synthase [candidate division KSB1 bacterium]MDZ7273873.1 fused MFS/spermidine synthase [candidate division KSB1 bacterium]MDZ7286029.1 fused MFS/spermidine synthase [candidate division KSB1 bacterium]MDZ7299061.1 fused MFS/spermidine synthase [candidate division KSB1 bacterium]MDZ7308198.1 fused MFS/spermidine synthase [candidate division KSB1 bacterium]